MLLKAAETVEEEILPTRLVVFSLESFNRRGNAENPEYYVGARHSSKAESGISGKFTSGARLS